MTVNDEFCFFAAVVVFLMLVFPPTVFVWRNNLTALPAGYHFILALSDDDASRAVNISQLLVQWLGVGLLAGVAWFIAKD